MNGYKSWATWLIAKALLIEILVFRKKLLLETSIVNYCHESS